MTELRSGKSIADVATEKGVDPQKVIDDVVGAIDGKIDKRVADKKLDQARADTMKQNLPQRVTDFVNKVWGQGRAKAKANGRAGPAVDRGAVHHRGAVDHRHDRGAVHAPTPPRLRRPPTPPAARRRRRPGTTAGD